MTYVLVYGCSAGFEAYRSVLFIGYLVLIHPSVCVVKVSQFPFGNLNGIGVLIRLLS